MSEEKIIQEFLEKVNGRISLVPDNPNLSERGALDAYVNVTHWVKELIAAKKTEPVKPIEGALLDLIDKARTYNDGWVFTQEELIAEYTATRASVKPYLQSGVEDAAKAHADKNSYQSDKHQFTITPWIQNNWAISDFKAGAEWQAQQVNSVMQWTSIKPELNKECILLTASEYKKEWSYTTFLITKIDSDEGWYWGLCDIDGKEWGDIDDLKADLYQVVELPETIIQ